MNWDEFCSQFELVGTTVAATPDLLPLRLSPVYRKRGEADVLYLDQEDDVDGPSERPPRLIRESEEWLRQQMTISFQPALAPLPDHWLMQMEADRQPEYLPRHQVAQRIALAYADALRQADLAAAARDANPTEVCSRLWYAVRAAAEPAEEVLPQLALVPWLKTALQSEDFAYFLRSFSQEVSVAVRKEKLAALRDGFPALGRVLLRSATTQAIADVCGLASTCYLDRMRQSLKNPAAVFQNLRSSWQFVPIKNPSTASSVSCPPR